ncbi:hypothetical protein [Coleofasciculus sp. FACHB-1120]|uniref:hypothetical protein n=1 Tax=Coleofasciculus sp. FACHB-1120 TaxID=2692783 RepID=UPI001689DC80|nr:hypothetical protein [Coleofasciculus sp. FACHB-1120]MBD2743660.1 hypothetical protein [Coleofasciculus sp. FACHB-1120]
MAAITPGTGGTIKSAMLEAHLLEIIAFGKQQESTPARNPAPQKNYIQGYTLTDTLFRCNLSIPVNRVTNENGESVYTTPDYLSGVTFTPGSNGTFKSGNFAAYLIEVVLYAQELERDSTKNPSGADRINGNFDINPNVFSGSVELPISPGVTSDGKPTFTAISYLLT